MPYYILEVQKFDKDGNHIPPSDFYVVNGAGYKLSKRCDTLEEAVGELRSLEARDKLEAEKKHTKGNSLGR